MQHRTRQRKTGPSERTVMAYEMRHLDAIAAELRERSVRRARQDRGAGGEPRQQPDLDRAMTTTGDLR